MDTIATFTEMLKNELQGEDAERYLMNLQLYKLYDNDDRKFVIDLKDACELVGFKKIDQAKKLLFKRFEKDTDYIITNELGKTKEQILINVTTFKCLCFFAKTDKGKLIRSYYHKIETIFFKFLEEQNTIDISALIYDMKKKNAFALHKKLIESHKNKTLVYILKLDETDEDNYIIEIVATEDIQKNVMKLRSDFSMCFITDVFPCVKFREFEKYILNRKDVKKNLVGINTIKISSEFTYNDLIKIMKKHVDKFDGLNPIQKLEIARMKHKEFIINYTANMEDIEMKNKLLQSVTSDINKVDIPHDLINSDPDSDSDNEDDQAPQDRHRRVFKYNPTNLKTPIQTFMSLREAARSLKNPNIHDYHIRNASLHNTVCEGFRWYFSDDELEPPPTIPDTITEATEKTPHNKGLVAQISLDKSTIINVFPSQKDVIKTMKITSGHISVAISKGKLASNFYWDMYDNCSSELKATFKDPLPKPIRVGTCSKTVQRIDPETNEVLETFACIQEVASKYKICHKTLNKLSDTSDIYKGFKWQIREQQCI